MAVCCQHKRTYDLANHFDDLRQHSFIGKEKNWHAPSDMKNNNIRLSIIPCTLSQDERYVCRYKHGPLPGTSPIQGAPIHARAFGWTIKGREGECLVVTEVSLQDLSKFPSRLVRFRYEAAGRVWCVFGEQQKTGLFLFDFRGTQKTWMLDDVSYVPNKEV